MVELIFSGTKTLWGSGYYKWYNFCFHKPWNGFIGGYSTSNLYKIFLDGTYVSVGRGVVLPTYLSGVGGVAVAYYQYRIYEIDPLAARPLWHKEITVAALDGTWPLYGMYVDKDRDILIRPGITTRIYRLSDKTLLQTLTHSFTSDLVLYYTNGQVAVIDCEGGGGFIYDYISDMTVRSFGLPTISHLGYDCIHNIFAAVVSNKIKIYSPYEAASALLAPTFVSPIRTNPYGGSQFYTRLTDSKGVPMPNRWIHFEVVGDRGSVEKDVVKTDTNGYAYNYYYGPATSDLGAETLRVYTVV